MATGAAAEVRLLTTIAISTRSANATEIIAVCSIAFRLFLKTCISYGRQYQRMFGRIQVKPADVFELGGDLGIAADLKLSKRCGLSPCARQMRRTPVSEMLIAAGWHWHCGAVRA